MGESENGIRANMEAQKDEEQAEEPTCPDELAMFEGGALRWKHILAVRARLNGQPE